MNDFCQQIIKELIERLVCADNGVTLESLGHLQHLLVDDLGHIEWEQDGCSTT